MVEYGIFVVQPSNTRTLDLAPRKSIENKSGPRCIKYGKQALNLRVLAGQPGCSVMGRAHRYEEARGLMNSYLETNGPQNSSKRYFVGKEKSVSVSKAFCSQYHCLHLSSDLDPRFCSIQVKYGARERSIATETLVLDPSTWLTVAFLEYDRVEM